MESDQNGIRPKRNKIKMKSDQNEIRLNWNQMKME